MSKKLKRRVRALELKIEVLTTLIDGYAEAYAKANVRPAHPSLQPVTMLTEEEARAALEAFYEQYPHFRPTHPIFRQMLALATAMAESISTAQSMERVNDEQAIPTPQHPSPDARAT